MLAYGQLSRIGQVLLLGLCEGDPRLAEATRASICGDATDRTAAADAGMSKTTFMRHRDRVRKTLQTLLGSGGVKPEELVENDDVDPQPMEPPGG